MTHHDEERRLPDPDRGPRRPRDLALAGEAPRRPAQPSAGRRETGRLARKADMNNHKDTGPSAPDQGDRKSVV